MLLYGNHNIFLQDKKYVEKNLYKFYDEYIEEESELFPGIKIYESLILKHTETGQEIFLLHGHQGDLMNDQFWLVSMLMLRYFWRFMHLIGFRNPASPARNAHKRHKIEKNFNKWNEKKRIIMICGHTHRPKFPKCGEVPYINTGCCVRPRGIVGVELVNDQLMMINWSIKPSENGLLRIERKVIKGPISIDSFNNIKNYCDAVESLEYKEEDSL